MARGLNAHGVAVGVVGYDLAPEVTIVEIIEQIRHACLFMWLRTGQRMMVYGHSAGGHLAAAMVATEWHELYPKTPADLVPAAYSVSGVSLSRPVQITMARICGLTRPRLGASRRCSGRHPEEPRLRCGGWRPGIERVAPSRRHRRNLGQGQRADLLRGHRGGKRFYFDRHDARSQSAMVGRLVELAQKGQNQ